MEVSLFKAKINITSPSSVSFSCSSSFATSCTKEITISSATHFTCAAEVPNCCSKEISTSSTQVSFSTLEISITTETTVPISYEEEVTST
ncbi:hypothetical protein ACLOJK_012692 [Asimina triloba]